MKIHTKIKENQKEMKEGDKLRYMTTAGIMAALITLMTAYICHVPVGANGGYVHFGDSLIYLASPEVAAASAIAGYIANPEKVGDK